MEESSGRGNLGLSQGRAAGEKSELGQGFGRKKGGGGRAAGKKTQDY